MEQKKRDRIAWIAAIVLAPILIYLLAANVFKAEKRQFPPAPSAPTEPTGIGPLPPLAVSASPLLDSKRAAEQQAIADRLPRRNPFSASSEASATPAVRTAPTTISVRSIDSAIKVTAIMSRSGSKRFAMINGRLLGEGDRVGEWTILKVNPQSVLLDNGSRQMVVGAK